ncbi:protein-glutamate O-methyltransferase CheR [Cohnella pontilimi]|uniref:protein-glutamate O-methyltransferase n=1 Tax=Cohnella pontilimi TaxID=2564100 RepID=A0A4U0FGU3_9BACL|nr:protein-glutamate O-methyltransferase CheR [Cohnella pontilimi]TJY42602.1 protein-glutamate O-methyltransferase CheR [Cohnella pontilimi]
MTLIAQPDRDFAQFTQQLKNKTGIDLSLYKEPQMKRRLNTMRESKGYRTFTDFFQAMQQNKELFEQMLDHMTINVSEFYRNANRWGVLERKVIPELLKSSRSLKLWSAACSTGDEPYSLVMVLSKFLMLNEIQVLATDIDKGVLAKAKQGVYPEASVKEVPKAMLNKHFTVEGQQYRVNDDIKKCVTFKPHNLLSDPFEPNFDLIVCRNVLIYFTEDAKEELFYKFSRSLKKGGYLFIGGSEQIFVPLKYGLEPLDTFFYRKI